MLVTKENVTRELLRIHAASPHIAYLLFEEIAYQSDWHDYNENSIWYNVFRECTRLLEDEVIDDESL